MNKLIFTLFALIANMAVAAPIHLTCTDTTPYNGVYRKVSVAFDESSRAVQINGINAKVLTINSSSIVADAYGYRHSINRITSEMMAFEIADKGPQLVFQCALAGKRAF